MVGSFLKIFDYYHKVILKRKRALLESNLLSNKVDAYTKKGVELIVSSTLTFFGKLYC